MVKFRLSPGLFQEMKSSLTLSTTVEQGCFMLCAEAKANNNHILIANQLIPLKANDFTVQKYDQLSVSPSAMLRVGRMAQAKNVGVCFIHTHPMSFGEVEFSRADDYGNVRTFEFFNRLLPEQANSALVFSGDMEAVSGRLYRTANNWVQINSVTVSGQPFHLETNGYTPNSEGSLDVYF